MQRSPVVRSVVKSAPVQHQVRTGRAMTIVRDRGRFLTQQLVGNRTARYELRGCGLTVHVRHRTGDVAILNKIFARDSARNSYEPPAEVAALLDARPPRILDVGANIGIFGVFALARWPGAEITAYEPDPGNRAVLRRTAAANDDGERWTVVGSAVSNAVGELRFVPGLGAEAHIAHPHEDRTISVPTVDFFEQVGAGVDLVKMDIEGGEWAILADPRLAGAPVTAIRLEWHRFHCPQPDARAEATRLLRAQGFEHVVDADHEHDANGVLWAWRDRA
jgi:FkbM family methyltransferase